MVTPWIVLDNNQAQPAIVRQAIDRWPECGITFTPFTLAEILLQDVALAASGRRPSGTSVLPRLVRAAGGRIRVGLEQGEIHARILDATEEGIRSMEPFLDDPRVTQVAFSVDDARRIKEEHEQKMARLRLAAETVRLRLAEAQVGTLSSFAEAEEAFASSPESLLPHMVPHAITDDGALSARVADSRTLYRAVMGNPFLRRFWRHVLGYLVTTSGLWKPQTFRGRSTDYLPRAGDWVDVTLLQYAADGDVVVTADRRLKDLAVVVDPERTVRVGTLAELA